MKQLPKIIDNLSITILLALAALLPLFFLPITTEFYDTGKLILLSVAILILLGLWGLKLITEERLVLVKTPLDILLVVYLLVVILSTFLSPNLWVSLYGLLPRIQGGLISQVAIVLFYFLVVANIKKVSSVNLIIDFLILASIILSLASLSSYFQAFLPFAFAKTSNFSLAGSPSATTLFLTILIPITIINLLRSCRSLSPILLFYFLALLLGLITIVLIGNPFNWVIAIFAISVTLIFYLKNSDRRLLIKGLFTPLMALIVIITTLLAILSYTPTIKDKTIIGKNSANFQKELQLPFDTSWKIAASSFRDSPILGTGPASFLYDFTSYKPIEFNQTSYWNIRFSSAFNQYLQSWAEIGGAGAILLLLISTTFIFTAIRHKDAWGLGMAGITFILCMALSPMTFFVEAIGFFVLALFMATVKSSDNQLSDLRLNHRAVDLPPALLLRSLLILPIVALIIGSSFVLGKFMVADIYHRQALNSLAANKGIDAYNSLVKAEVINPNVDLYRIDLAQTNFALANAIALQKGPTQASPAGSLTDQDKANIQQLLQQSIAEGRSATILSPRSSGNWEILGSIYRQISGVATNGLQFALDSYGRAIQLDPLNPLLRLAVGGIYYQIKNYDLAVRFFDDTVTLKPDYANGLYNLAIALRDKGNLTDAVTVAENLVAQLQDKPDSQDYKTASTLLSELKAKAPSPSSSPNIASPSALENQSLPKVLDKSLSKPENVSTPAAVKKESQ